MGNKTLYHHMQWQSALVLTCHRGKRKKKKRMQFDHHNNQRIDYNNVWLGSCMHHWYWDRSWGEEKEEQRIVCKCVFACAQLVCVFQSSSLVALSLSLRSRQGLSDEDKCPLHRNPIDIQMYSTAKPDKLFIVTSKVKWIQRKCLGRWPHCWTYHLIDENTDTEIIHVSPVDYWFCCLA